ncbi:MAG TPA: putative peptide maturation dehydrogenase [Xanthomonadales bacterium]|nr:putative peptide maturation dehydrogenase [Xanthomonadales bacterium]
MSESSTWLRRCAVVFIEPHEDIEFDLAELFRGETALRATLTWRAHAPHLDAAETIGAGELLALGDCGESSWLPRAPLDAKHGRDAVDALLRKGLLIAYEGEPVRHRERDARLREVPWFGTSAMLHYATRWRSRDLEEESAEAPPGLADISERWGHPPALQLERVAARDRIPLARPAPDAHDELLARRATCRNYDEAPLAATELAALLWRVFGYQAVAGDQPGLALAKRTSPSAGSLHPVEAYVLARRVDGVATGLYHYHAGAHALEPIRSLDATEASTLARRFVAGQPWFAGAHVQVALVARFARNFWKYRRHPKAYRAVVLDAGHLSQTLMIEATRAGLGAFVTAAINEVDIEQAFGLDELAESPIAVCGFGARGGAREYPEFDPLGTVWR